MSHSCHFKGPRLFFFFYLITDVLIKTTVRHLVVAFYKWVIFFGGRWLKQGTQCQHSERNHRWSAKLSVKNLFNISDILPSGKRCRFPNIRCTVLGCARTPLYSSYSLAPYFFIFNIFVAISFFEFHNGTTPMLCCPIVIVVWFYMCVFLLPCWGIMLMFILPDFMDKDYPSMFLGLQSIHITITTVHYC